jgi:hypothetical protein
MFIVARLLALVLVATLVSPQLAHAKGFWDWLLGPPGSGIHIIPDPRPPVPPGQGGGGTPPPPPTFGTLVGAFIKFIDDVSAMKNWYTALTPAEQAEYQAAYEATLARVAAEEERLAQTILLPLATGNERTLYGFFDLVRKMDPIRARAVFLGTLDKLAKRINMDYTEDPSNPIKARRARDVVALRSWVGRQT